MKLANAQAAGGVGTLSYEHHNIEEPAILSVTPFRESGG